MRKIKLVLSGSGTRFPVFIGAIKRLLEEGYEIEEVCGTSGGAIISAGFALGMSVDELTKLCLDILPRLNELVSFSFSDLLNKQGVISGDKIEKEFLSHTGKANFESTKIPLKVITVNVDQDTVKEPYTIFGTKETPKSDIAKAVRASMSLPIIFTPVLYNNDRYIDGGVTASMPLDVYGEDAHDVIGLKILPIKNEGANNLKIPFLFKPFKDLILFTVKILEIVKDAFLQEYIDDAKGAKIIDLKTRHSGLNFSLTKEDILDMIEEGYNSTDANINNMDHS